jgi:hypothetical protein
MRASLSCLSSPLLILVTDCQVLNEPPLKVSEPPKTWLTSGENRLIEPPKVAEPMSLALPGPRSTTTPPMVEAGKNDVEWWVGPLASPQGIPS